MLAKHMSQVTAANSSSYFVAGTVQQEDLTDCLESANRVNLFALANLPPQEENISRTLRRNPGRPLIPHIAAFIENEA